MEHKKEDLRVIKTKAAIKDTFLEMRRTIPLEKIRVRDICKQALINKSTFYAHYADAFALSDQLEDAAIHEFLEQFDAKNCLFENPKLFLTEMPRAFDKNMDTLMPLFRGRLEVAFQKISRELKTIYSTDEMTQIDDIRLTFVLDGTLNTLRKLKFEKDYDNDTLAQTIAEMLNRLFEHRV